VLENIIYKVLTGSPQIADSVARYGKKPAIFFKMAAPDNDANWNNKHQYPQIVYFVDQQYHPERKAEGMLQIDFLCDEKCHIVPEDMGESIVKIISELFLTKGNTTTCILWNRSDSFDQPGTGQNAAGEYSISGETHSFDLFQFPAQITTNPDPILALNMWTKKAFPMCVLIGYDNLPDIWRPTDQRPALYWRTTGTISAVKTSFAVAWVDVTIVGHVIAGSPSERQKWIRGIVNSMALSGEIALKDGSPMVIRRIAYASSANPIRDGQITITGRYGILRNQNVQPILRNITIT